MNKKHIGHIMDYIKKFPPLSVRIFFGDFLILAAAVWDKTYRLKIGFQFLVVLVKN